jgi:hypothetical protein
VIRLSVNGTRSLAGALPEGATAYVDADWIPRSVGEVPALVADAEGIRWNDGPAAPLSGASPDVAAAPALREVAAEAVSRVPDEVARVKILGDGLVAAEARRLLGARASGGGAPDERPSCVLDATGDPDTILAALKDLADLGTLVAAGPLGDRALPVNLYSDIHLRGLKVIGVAPPLAGGHVPATGDEPAGEAPVQARLGEPLAGGRWFRVDA